MAKSVSSSQDSFSCPICLDLLKDPVTIPCGHSYCLGCISYYWDQNHNNQKDVYNCPQCRRTFSSRPGLYKSTTIVEMMEQLKNAGILVTPAGQDGCVGVSCDVCSGEKHEAVRSCLVCLASYCELHLQPHYQSTAFKKHKLVKASTNLQEKLCSEHEKMLEAFCRTDHQCVCMQCMLGKHKGHDIIIADTERGERQKHLEEIQRKFKQRIQEREKELQELRSEMDTYKHSAQAAVKDCEMIYTELIRSIERRCAEVTELIRAQEKTAVGRAERVLRQLEQEVTELKNRDAELEQLLHTEDHIRFLQRFSSVSAPPTELPSVTVNQLYTFKDVVKSISELRERLEDLSKQDMHKLSADVKAIHITGPLIREDFLEYACHLTLDPNTAYRHLCLTEGNKKVTYSDSPQPYTDDPRRFNAISQVLCQEGLSSCHYWEVEMNGRDGVSIALSYDTVGRKGWGCECVFGCDHQSWSLNCSLSGFSLWNKNSKSDTSATCRSSKVGVYVNHRAGELSFYSAGESLTLLHQVKTKFTQPLFPGFAFGYYGSAVKICDL
ncbi:E3 ubiquitin/ISG15 ligase TRIM25-like isoform X2 [Brachyhypopomus gauderio]|uniref:E3 ubiquitin/ISG15 ligase TRIM25-like isoform X2 n=1 Tax=Brachyhypopomus gauderio TaxID=698409 RepID=UPI0040438053